MSVRTNENYEEAAREGETELVLVAVTYVGEHSTYTNDSIRSQGGYPALDAFQKGQTKMAKIPSPNLGWWERHADFEIIYDDVGLAECLIEKNFVPQQIVGPGFDPAIREQLLDQIGIEVAATEEEYLEQLREVAGVEDEEETVDDKEQSRIKELINNEDRSILIKVVNSFDGVDEYLDDVDKTSVSHLSQHEAAEFLLEQEADMVDARLDKASMGQEL